MVREVETCFHENPGTGKSTIALRLAETLEQRYPKWKVIRAKTPPSQLSTLRPKFDTLFEESKRRQFYQLGNHLLAKTIVRYHVVHCSPIL
jgi:DNA polymerase III delta prime subunit